MYQQALLAVKSGRCTSSARQQRSPKFFDAGQCVRFKFGDLARVDKSDKVEAAVLVWIDLIFTYC